MTCDIFHEITSPIRSLNPLGFPNTTRSDRNEANPNGDAQTMREMAEAMKRQADAATQMMQHIQEERNERVPGPRLPSDDEPHSSIKSTWIPKYMAERSV
ncbi:uncharacterized protein G2W53_014496 [Senna tora]|uniref:Uncharacterized protein n=1 Tax=Senna tora TaxID=362788 RepID=A0A834WTD4_9FABA|nr:uncharacterized protein G2W53_014496 [Senna tora]